ncbi:uncharacterized protein LOC129598192 [Paramacrobiotus metropolitanus]|uniref:uncharacterized protein LOC129598192 n=1 Tax=Paramacrobiotus metropolitanus TaxID=2943436 RepID=UPI00244583A6|nr:uncharacterized protein LOC129598192 [Paramacrobiotus metropolitanus]
MERYRCRLKFATTVPLGLCVMLSLTSSTSSACPTAVPKACRNATCHYSIATLERIVQEATYNPASEKIQLVFDQPAPNAVRSLVQVISVDSGGSASFSCPVHNVTFTTPLQLPYIGWTHQGRDLAVLGNGRLISDGPFDLEHSVRSRPVPGSPFADVNVTLALKSVAWQASGDLSCLQPCNTFLLPSVRLPIAVKPGDVPFCGSPYQLSRLLVFPSASELFAVPMSNVSVRRGSDAQFTCAANLRVAGSTPAFIWRFNGYVIAAPGDHPLQALVRVLDTHRGGSVSAERFPLRGISTAKAFTFSVTYLSTATTVNSTLSVSHVDLNTSARVECWVRPEADQEVWRRQIAYLHVLTTPAA